MNSLRAVVNKVVGNANVPTETFRRMYVNDHEANKQFEFCSNNVVTAKYSVYSFIPKNLFEQFHRLSNVYFLLISILQISTDLSPTNKFSTALPLTLVLLANMAKEIWEDKKRHKADSEVNFAKTYVLERNQFVQKAWHEVRVGDVVHVTDGNEFPADLVLLSSSSDEGTCFVDTKNLDGETNLKVRECMAHTKDYVGVEELNKMTGVCEYELPNNHLYSFDGAWIPHLKHSTASDAIPISISNILLRGSRLRTTEFVNGVVVFTGLETKLMQNTRETPSKRSNVDKLVNKAIGVEFIALAVLCTVVTIAQVIWRQENSGASTYLTYLDSYTGADDAGVWISALILFNNLVPISLYVTIEIVKLVQGQLIENDLQMYYEPIDHHALARTTALNEELGQVQYVFSDKTGTLTRNEMKFRKCWIKGTCYGSDAPDNPSEELLAKAKESQYCFDPSFGFADPRLLTVARDWRHTDNSAVCEMMKLLALCHNVLAQHPDDQRKNLSPERLLEIQYHAESPDEAALVGGARAFGFSYLERVGTTITLDVLGEPVRYELLAVNQFNSTRKRMSVAVRRPDGSIVLYCKGADSHMIPHCHPPASAAIPSNNQDSTKLSARHRKRRPSLTGSQGIDPAWTDMDGSLADFATEGLRTLVCAKRELSVSEWERWHKVYHAASVALDDRETKLDEAASAIECNMEIVGVTAIEDKLQLGVPETVYALGQAGITVWVLTGDKVETTINIGYSCKVLQPGIQMLMLTCDDADEVKLRMRGLLDQFVPSDSRTELEGEVDVDKMLLQEKLPDDLIVVDDKDGPGSGRVALIISGDALRHILADDFLRHGLVTLGKHVNAVLCCRVSPLQKAMVVRVVRDLTEPRPITLSIGDGANDVPMIQEADVGVGISGKEGMQAVRAADFAVAQFRFLQRLLFVHGRWNYRRICLVILYSFYKNVTLVFTLFWFTFFSGFSGTALYESFMYSGYNVAFTAFPILVVGILDQDVLDVVAIGIPSLYYYGFHRIGFGVLPMIIWICRALVHSVLIFFISVNFFTSETVMTPGMDAPDIYEMGTGVFGALLFTVTGVLALQTHNWDAFSVGSFILSILLWFSFVGISQYYEAGVYYMVGNHIMARPAFWFNLLIMPVITVFVLDVSLEYTRRTYFPTVSDVAREISCGCSARLPAHKRLPGQSARNQKRLRKVLPTLLEEPSYQLPLPSAITCKRYRTWFIHSSLLSPFWQGTLSSFAKKEQGCVSIYQKKMREPHRLSASEEYDEQVRREHGEKMRVGGLAGEGPKPDSSGASETIPTPDEAMSFKEAGWGAEYAGARRENVVSEEELQVDVREWKESVEPEPEGLLPDGFLEIKQWFLELVSDLREMYDAMRMYTMFASFEQSLVVDKSTLQQLHERAEKKRMLSRAEAMQGAEYPHGDLETEGIEDPKAVKQEFDKFFLRMHIDTSRLTLLVVTTFVFISGMMSLIERDGDLRGLIPAYVFITVSCAVLVVSYHQIFEKYYYYVISLCAILAGIYQVLLITQHGMLGLTFYFVVVFHILPLPFAVAVRIAGLQLFFYAIGILINMAYYENYLYNGEDLVRFLLILIVVAIITAHGSFLRHRAIRRSFILHRRIKSERARADQLVKASLPQRLHFVLNAFLNRVAGSTAESGDDVIFDSWKGVQSLHTHVEEITAATDVSVSLQDIESAARKYHTVTVVVVEITNLKAMAKAVSSGAALHTLALVEQEFNGLCAKYRLMRLPLVGETFMAIGGLGLGAENPDAVGSDPVVEDDESCGAPQCLEVAAALTRHALQGSEENNELHVRVKSAITSGSIVSGIVMREGRPQYNVIGEILNIGKRLARLAEENTVVVAPPCYDKLKDDYDFNLRQVAAAGVDEGMVYVLRLPDGPLFSFLEKRTRTVSIRRGDDGDTSPSPKILEVSGQPGKMDKLEGGKQVNAMMNTDELADYLQKKVRLHPITRTYINRPLAERSYRYTRFRRVQAGMRRMLIGLCCVLAYFGLMDFWTSQDWQDEWGDYEELHVEESTRSALIWARFEAVAFLVMLTFAVFIFGQRIAGYYAVVVSAAVVFCCLLLESVLAAIRGRFTGEHAVFELLVVVMLYTVTNLHYLQSTVVAGFALLAWVLLTTTTDVWTDYYHGSWRDEIKNEADADNERVSSGTAEFLSFLGLYLLTVCVLVTNSYQLESLSRFNHLLFGFVQKEINVADALLGQSIPYSALSKLKDGHQMVILFCHQVSIIHADLSGITRVLYLLRPRELLEQLRKMSSLFEALEKRHHVRCLSWVSNSYVGLSGVAWRVGEQVQTPPAAVCAYRAVVMALAMLDAINGMKEEDGMARRVLDMRVGVHTADMVGGVLPVLPLRFNLWGTPVSVAEAVCQRARPMSVCLSDQTFKMVQGVFETEAERTCADGSGGSMTLHTVLREKPQYM
eukprot:Rmarinus@m.21668